MVVVILQKIVLLYIQSLRLGAREVRAPADPLGRKEAKAREAAKEAKEARDGHHGEAVRDGEATRDGEAKGRDMAPRGRRAAEEKERAAARAKDVSPT